MPQTHKISRNNTTVASHPDGSRSVTLHQTEVVRWNPNERRVILNTGGWFTVTTRNRMAQALNEWDLPVRVGFARGHVGAETYNPETGATKESFPFVGDVCHVVY